MESVHCYEESILLNRKAHLKTQLASQDDRAGAVLCHQHRSGLNGHKPPRIHGVCILPTPDGMLMFNKNVGLRGTNQPQLKDPKTGQSTVGRHLDSGHLFQKLHQASAMSQV